MSTLFSIYFWAILAAVIAAPTLAWIGCHLAARDKAMQTLCVGQGATLGVLLGLGILKSYNAPHWMEDVGPLFSAMGLSAATFYFGELVVAKRHASRNSFYSAIFGSLLALGYLVCALFPPLENHMTHVFFGDLATLSDHEAWLGIGITSVVFVLMLFQWRNVSRQSFLYAVFGEKMAVRGNRGSYFIFNLLALVVLSFSVEFLGFLFTVSCLFLPTTLMTGVTKKSLSLHYLAVTLLASASALIGFGLSLMNSRLPTVPSIVAVMMVLGTSAVLGRRVSIRS